MKRNRMVLIIWVDSNIVHGWISPGEASSHHVAEAQSVGFFVKEDDKEIVIAMGESETGLLIECKAIPKGCIKSVKELRIK